MKPDTGTKPFDLQELVKQVEGRRFPPVDRWNPPFCGDIDMQIKADGTWYYMGTPIGRARMVRLFSTVLRRDEDGKFYLVTPVEKIGITVDDAPFVATGLEHLSEGDTSILKFTTNVGDSVIAGPKHPVRVDIDAETGEPRPYILVRGRLEALIGRAVFYDLVDLATTEAEGPARRLMIESNGAKFCLGTWREDGAGA